MFGSRTSEKLVLFVLAAILSTLFGGQALLRRAGSPEPHAVIAAERATEGLDLAESVSGGLPGPGAEQPAGASDSDTGMDAVNPVQATGAVPAIAPESVATEERRLAWTGPVRVRGTMKTGGKGISAQLDWRPVDSQGDEEVRTVETDREGNFAVTLTRAGRYMVQVQPIGFWYVATWGGLEMLIDIPGQAVARVPLTLPTGQLEGRLETADGVPVEDAFVELVSAQDGFGCGSADLRPRRSMSDQDGRFRFEFLQAGDYAISTICDPIDGSLGKDEGGVAALVHASTQLVSVEEDGQTTVSLRLPRQTAAGASQTELQVRVSSEGQPVSGVTVWLRRSDQPALPGRPVGVTGRDGLVSMPGLEPDQEYFVFARDARSRTKSKPIELDTARIELELEPALDIRLTTSDREGRGLAAFVEVTSNAQQDLVWARSVPLDRAHTEAQVPGGTVDLSRHCLGPFLPGTYHIRAWTEDGRQASREVTLEVGGEALDFDLRLRSTQ